MVCPRCGADNVETAAQCSQCHYKFRFGHAHGDPSQAMYFTTAPEGKVDTKPNKPWRFVIIAMFVLFALIFGFSIVESFLQ